MTPNLPGMSFGLTSGVITTLGLMVGLNSGTASTLVVVGGILTIAVADAMSDALGIHVEKEVENHQDPRNIWLATLLTFISKFVMAMTFVVPVLFLPLSQAVIVCVIWGYVSLGFFSYWIARSQKRPALPVISEHLLIATLVIVCTHFLGLWVSIAFESAA